MIKKIIAGIVVAIILALALFIKFSWGKGKPGPAPTPTPGFAEQLPPEKQPKITLDFTEDAHYVTVTMSNLFADQLEYNIIYDATVKSSKIQTGVNAQSSLDGKSTYSQKQLLGSESSGKFTYHSKIQNATLELTLRDSAGRSIFTSSYPFEVAPGDSVDLSAS